MPKVMIITGASRGIGAAIARKAGAAGYAVAVNYATNRMEAEAVVSSIVENGARAVAVRADVSDPAEVDRLFAEVDAALGPVDVLVSNAGILGGISPIEETTAELLTAVFAANVFSVFYCAREAVKRMSGRPDGGVILNISSTAARTGGMPNEAHYASTKGAVDSFTLALSKELAGRNIRVNALRPGVISTTMHDPHGGAATIAKVAPTIPLGRAGTVDDVAETALWLVSDAAAYVHGALIDVSGGR